MANLTIVFFPEPGHLTPIGDVVRALLRRGHRATFITVPDAVPLAEPYGCPIAIIGEDEFPPGAMDAARALPTRQELRRRYQVIDRFMLKVAHGAYDDVIRGTKPDVLLADSILGSSPCVRVRTASPPARIARRSPTTWRAACRGSTATCCRRRRRRLSCVTASAVACAC